MQFKESTSMNKVIEIFKNRLLLTAMLSLSVLISILLESIGFGMLLPLLEVLIGSGSESKLGDIFNHFFGFFGIEINLVNVTVAFALIMMMTQLPATLMLS